MLYKETVSASTLAIIQQLCKREEFLDFELVGGTALALHIGHRISVDIDLFCKSNFEVRQIKECLLDYFGDHQITFDYEAKNTLIGSIDGIKIDFIRHAYPSLKNTLTSEGMRLCQMEDIAAMKISAITDNGTRIKDFVDLYYLLQHFSLKDIIQFYQIKYPSANTLFALKSISYFNDLDPASINNIVFTEAKKITFEELKSALIKATEEYFKNEVDLL